MSAPEGRTDDVLAAPAARAEGIPEAPVGAPLAGSLDADDGEPVGPTPAFDFWQAIYTRRSIRKFKPDPVPRALVEQVLHAGIWAPSSCNYQMWDFVAVDDPALNAPLAALSAQMGNAPVNIVVSYGRDFSEEAWANIQSASAAIQNMSLAAHVLGLGTFWITQTGDREKVRELVGLPEDRLVIAVLALGYPRVLPKKGPKRRPLAQVAHWNHYAGRPIPSSSDPEDWDRDLLAIYQRARVLNGLRHNKPRAWEARAVTDALARLVPDGASASASFDAEAPVEPTRRWLDVLPCNGIVTERLACERQGFAFDVVERTEEVAEFAAGRAIPRARALRWGASASNKDASLFPEPRDASYAMVSCIFRLENLACAEREELVRAMARWLAPGGQLLIGCVNRRSFHDLTEWLRRRRGGPGGVEYVLAPDPNIGPFTSLDVREIEGLARAAGLTLVRRFGCQAVPQPEEVAFRARNFSRKSRKLVHALGWVLLKLELLPGLRSRRGRFQFLLFRR